MIEAGAVAHLEGAHHRATGAVAGLARKDTSGWLASAGAFSSPAAPLGTEDRSETRIPQHEVLKPPGGSAGGSGGGSGGRDVGSAGSAGSHDAAGVGSSAAGSPGGAAGSAGGDGGSAGAAGVGSSAAGSPGGAAGQGGCEPPAPGIFRVRANTRTRSTRTSRTAMALPNERAARYQMGPRSTRGLIAGWRTGQIIFVAVGLVLAVGVLRSIGGVEGAFLGLLIVSGAVAAATWPIGGRSLEQWVPTVVTFVARTVAAGRYGPSRSTGSAAGARSSSRGSLHGSASSRSTTPGSA